MATNPSALEAAVAEATTSRAPKVQASRPTRAELVARLTATGAEQAATFTDINGVERPTTSVRVYGGQPAVMLMAAE